MGWSGLQSSSPARFFFPLRGRLCLGLSLRCMFFPVDRSSPNLHINLRGGSSCAPQDGASGCVYAAPRVRTCSRRGRPAPAGAVAW